MKIYIQLLLVVFMLGCDTPKQQVYTREKISYENNSYNDIDNWDYVIRFKYDGHSYIKFGRARSQWGVHDPDCKCNNRERVDE